MSRGRYKKLYYVPGLISLILVPLLFVYFGHQKYKELNKYVIEVNLYSPSSLDTLYRRPQFLNRNFEEVILNTNTEENKTKLAFAKQRLTEMVSSNDSTEGIHISFRDAKYVAYVDAIDILAGMENVAKLIDKDGIRYFNLWRPTHNFFVCGGVIREYYPLPEPSFLEKLEMLPDTIGNELKFFFPTLKELWSVLLMFLVLIALNIAHCCRLNKTST